MSKDDSADMRLINLKKSGQALDAILNWFASLRVRLIATYVFVTVLTFGFTFLLLTQPVQYFIMKREENLLQFNAMTLGTTIRSPIEGFPTEECIKDLFWTQRRCQLYLHEEIPDIRVRVLDPQGMTLVDSNVPIGSDWGKWQQWWHKQRFTYPSLKNSEEVRTAIRTHQTVIRPSTLPNSAKFTGFAEPFTLYLAMPCMKTNKDTGKRELAFLMYLERPANALIKDMQEMRQRINLGLLTSLLLTMLVSILLASRLSAGLNSATRIARAFARGDVGRRIRARGRDEVGQLGIAFNQMADALQRQELLRRDLLADVSHELRTPLTAIAGCADTLADGTLQEDPAAAERFLGIIMRESERMQRLVSDILELSRLQAGVVVIPRAPLPIAPLIDDAVEIARLHARQEGIVIEWAPPADGDALIVLGNEDRLAQALRNLLDNARHHTPEDRKIYVTVATEPSEIIVHVRDEGEGIPLENLPWVFDRFYRAGKGGTKTGGTGLGLAIVREIMHAHQGRVTVESDVGRGTTFSLHLPRAQAELAKKTPLSSGA
jgi:signal transduction histidine kinase